MPSNPPPPEQVFRDPVLYQWFFFRRSDVKALGQGETSTESDFLNRFWQIVRKAGEWANVPLLDSKEIIIPDSPNVPEFNLKPRRSIRLASHPWKEKGGTLEQFEIDSRSLLDVLWLHVGHTWTGAYSAATLPPITNQEIRFNKLPPEGEFFISEANCFYAEFDNTPVSLAQWHKWATEMVEKWLPTLEGKSITFEVSLQYGYFAYVDGAEKETLILFVHKRHRDDIKRLLNLLLPNLSLVYLKHRFIEREYDEELSQLAHRTIKNLNEQLKSALSPGHSLDKLETQTSTLAEQYLALLPVIEAIENRLQTLRINAYNLTDFCLDSAWGTTMPIKLPQQKRIEGLIKQMESDLHYVSITQKKAEVASEQLQTVASIRVAKSERNITLALSFFAVMAVAQVFPKSPWGDEPDPFLDVAWKIGTIILSAAFIFALSLWWRRGKK